MFASVIISAKAAGQLSDGYPWVFERDVLSRRFETAGIVAVQDKRGRFLGQAFYSPKSKIALRFITKSKAPVDKNFWRKRVLEAFERRLKNINPPLKKGGEGGFAFRVVYAESDGIPSVIIDKYNDIFAVQITSAGAETIKNDIFSIIVEEFKPSAVIEKNNIEVRKIEGLPPAERVVFGNKTTTIITEGDQKFEVDVLHGQKTGAYLDYRAFRLKTREFAQGDCLDLFCYQGWFACQIANKAERIVAVDASQGAIAAARRNAELNGHKNIEFVCADVFDYLAACKERFDFIHLDPPPFAKGRGDLPSALKGYKKINAAAMKLLKPDGTLFTSSCSHRISERMFENVIIDAANIQGLKFSVIYRGIQDKDHPILKGFPESLYLKAIAVHKK